MLWICFFKVRKALEMDGMDSYGGLVARTPSSRVFESIKHNLVFCYGSKTNPHATTYLDRAHKPKNMNNTTCSSSSSISSSISSGTSSGSGASSGSGSGRMAYNGNTRSHDSHSHLENSPMIDYNNNYSPSSEPSPDPIPASYYECDPSIPRSASLLSSSFRFAHLRRLSTNRNICSPAAAHNPSPYDRIPSLDSIPLCSGCGISHALKDHYYNNCNRVVELMEGDSARNVVEIIFKTSWVGASTAITKAQNGRWSNNSNCKINKVFRVQNSPILVAKFEEYRNVVKSRASEMPTKYSTPRCVVDGNELLRFHGSAMECDLGLGGCSSLCSSNSCHICHTLQHGFSSSDGICNTSSSKRAHDYSFFLQTATGTTNTLSTFTCTQKKVVLVCRVIAGCVKSSDSTHHQSMLSKQHGKHNAFVDIDASEYDSIGGPSPSYEELVVFNPTAVLPCFIVVYETL